MQDDPNGSRAYNFVSGVSVFCHYRFISVLTYAECYATSYDKCDSFLMRIQFSCLSKMFLKR